MENSISVLGKISISWSNKGKDLKLWHHHHSRLRQVTYLNQCSFEWDQITSGDLFQPKLFGDSESLCNSSLGKYQKVVFVIEETNSKTERISERMRFIKKVVCARENLLLFPFRYILPVLAWSTLIQ